MEQDYRKTEEGKRTFSRPRVYEKTLAFQDEMKKHGIAWHNHFSDECTIDFCCCVGDNILRSEYNTYIPSFKTVVKQALEELYDIVKHGDEEHKKWLKNEFDKYIDKY